MAEEQLKHSTKEQSSNEEIRLVVEDKETCSDHAVVNDNGQELCGSGILFDTGSADNGSANTERIEGTDEVELLATERQSERYAGGLAASADVLERPLMTSAAYPIEWKPALASGSDQHGILRQFTNAAESVQNVVIMVLIAACALLVGWLLIGLTSIFHEVGKYTHVDSSQTVLTTMFNNVHNLDQVLGWLPLTVIACVLTTVAASYVARESRSREIEWTDTHLILEHSGPVCLAIRWTAIKSVSQKLQWDIFHGLQPVFCIEIDDDTTFTVKLSDIAIKYNVGTFFSLIKTNAPEAMLAVDPGFSSDNSYTELWLKYFSIPAQRDRTSILQNDMLVDSGRYKVIGTIGGGGQGTAYLAVVNDLSVPFEMSDGAEVAPGSTRHIVVPKRSELYNLKEVVLKEYILPVHRGQLTAERTAEKLQAEAKILQSLRHPQIVKLQDAFIEDYRGYLVLEYVHGESLKNLIERLGPQPEEVVADWGIQICRILGYLHRQSPPIVHRDITPDNLLLQEDGQIKLVDFNVAHQVDSSATATVVGKHAYIPAEQFRGKPTTQSDIYSLGGSLFFLLTGKEPEPITQSHPQRFQAHVTEQMNDIVAKATSAAVEARFASVQEMKNALGALLKTDGSTL